MKIEMQQTEYDANLKASYNAGKRAARTESRFTSMSDDQNQACQAGTPTSNKVPFFDVPAPGKSFVDETACSISESSAAKTTAWDWLDPDLKLRTVLQDVFEEATRARKNYPPMASFHEGYSIILEELDELWDEVKKQPLIRNPGAMRKEATQVAAMAVRFILDLCLGG